MENNSAENPDHDKDSRSVFEKIFQLGYSKGFSDASESAEFNDDFAEFEEECADYEVEERMSSWQN